VFRTALCANRVAGDEELRVGYVALGGGSLGRHAARHANVHAVFGAQAGGSVERSGLSSVGQRLDPVKRPMRQRLDPVKRPVRQRLDPVKRPVRQRLDPANLGKVSFFNYRDRCTRLVRPFHAHVRARVVCRRTISDEHANGLEPPTPRKLGSDIFPPSSDKAATVATIATRDRGNVAAVRMLRVL
jgi:hypothetical protein